MIHFMVCDTDVSFLQELAKVLHQMYDPCSVEYMYGPDALEAFLCAGKNKGDVLITEVNLRSRNAIDILEKYQKPSDAMQVVYLTGDINHCTDVYRTKHVGFLHKPTSLEALKSAVDRGVQVITERKETGITLQQGGDIYVLDAAWICYIESRGRQIRAVTKNEAITVYEKISALQKQLDQRFFQCHKSYLVNFDKVQQFLGDAFLMKNGTMIPISQSKRKTTRELFLAYRTNQL